MPLCYTSKYLLLEITPTKIIHKISHSGSGQCMLKWRKSAIRGGWMDTHETQRQEVTKQRDLGMTGRFVPLCGSVSFLLTYVDLISQSVLIEQIVYFKELDIHVVHVEASNFVT